MAKPLKQSTAVTVVVGPFVDDTDFKTAETALTITQADVRLSKNGAAFAQKNEATSATHRENGHYAVPLDATDTNTLGLLRLVVAETGALQVWEDFEVLPAQVFDSLYGADVLQVDLAQWLGVAPNALVTGDVPANLKQWLGVAPNALLQGRVQSMPGTAVGTADSGSTTTVVDAERTEAGTDYWKGAIILFTNGTLAGQARLVTAFDAATDTITFAPATTVAVGTHTYVLLPQSVVDVRSVLAAAIVASSFAVDSIDAAALATSAGQEIADRVLGRNVAGGSDSGRLVKEAFQAIRNRVAISGGTMTVYQTDDVTPLWTGAVTTAAGDPITDVDPA